MGAESCSSVLAPQSGGGVAKRCQVGTVPPHSHADTRPALSVHKPAVDPSDTTGPFTQTSPFHSELNYWSES